jgi:hypothetical protein
MRIPPLIQRQTFDVADWEKDAEFGIFPQGARAKDAVFAPDSPDDPVLVPGKRYLFKRSKRSYPDQFWGEVIAYRIGCFMGLEIPPAFVAINSETGISATLIEWFYTDGRDGFLLGGDLLKNIQPDFDREKGERHNVQDNVRLMELFRMSGVFRQDWQQWWADALLFDALIGNTDRHQDNWGLIFSPSVTGRRETRLSPLFDNGTSLGHERYPERIATWRTEDFQRYIAKGKHHLKWSLDMDGVGVQRHGELLAKVLDLWPQTRQIAADRLEFDFDEMVATVRQLMSYDVPERLTEARLDFIVRLLELRYQNLKALLS